MFEGCGIAKAKNGETVRFISEKVEVTTELAANKVYLDIILEESLDSNFNTESLNSSVDLGLDIDLQANKILSSRQLLRQP